MDIQVISEKFVFKIIKLAAIFNYRQLILAIELIQLRVMVNLYNKFQQH